MQKRADDKTIKHIIKKVLEKNRIIESRRLLLEIVNEELNSMGMRGTGYERLRRIASGMKNVKIETRNVRGDMPEKCPVCGNDVRDILSRNLEGEEVVVGRSCKRCGYRGSNGKWRVGKYTFLWVE